MSPENGNRAGEGAGHSVGIPSSAAEFSPSPTPTQAPNRLIVRLELDASNSGLSYRRLRFLLKSLVRQHRIRCIAIGPDRGRP